MALRGTLEDLGIVDVIQLPQRGRRTGVLVVSNQQSVARLYYEKGELVHADADGEQGIDALVELVDWTQGEFELRLGESTQDRTVEMDLHRAVMHALKARDERKLAEEKRASEAPAGKDARGIERALRRFVSTQKFAVYACVVEQDGGLVAEAERENGGSRGMEQLREVVAHLVSTYPRKDLAKITIEEKRWVVLFCTLSGGRGLLALTRAGTPIGAVMMAVTKLVRDLDGGR